MIFDLDITLPALHQDAPKSRDDIYKRARSAKAKQYPHKDRQGRLINASVYIPFTIPNMGGLCKEGHEFLRMCQMKDVEKDHYMMNVLISEMDSTSHQKIILRANTNIFFHRWLVSHIH